MILLALVVVPTGITLVGNNPPPSEHSAPDRGGRGGLPEVKILKF